MIGVAKGVERKPAWSSSSSRAKKSHAASRPTIRRCI
jgi:hypothetical protein